MLPCSILSSRNPSPARFLPPAGHASPRSFLACSHHQPSLPQPSLPPLTLRACVASLLPLSLPLLSPSLLLSLPPLVPSPTITLLPPSLLLSLPPLVPSPTITLLPPLPPCLPLSLPLFILPRPFPVSQLLLLLLLLPPSHPCSLRPSHLLFSRAPSLPLAACLPPAVQLNIHCVCIQFGELHWLLFREGQPCVALRQRRGRARSAGGSRLPWQRTPTTNPFLTNSKKSDGRNVLQTHINTVDAITFPMVLAATPRAI